MQIARPLHVPLWSVARIRLSPLGAVVDTGGMARFSDFDTRSYRTVDVRTGYGEWVGTYERTVEDAMDIALLDALTVPPWPVLHAAADLACGTGRTGAWLHRHGVGAIDGVDLTPEM